MKIAVRFSVWMMALLLLACSQNQQDARADDANDSTQMKQPGMMELMDQNMAQMRNMPSTGNADRDFAALMKIHHQGAVDMAREELVKGNDAQLKAMADNIINTQRNEMAAFDGFLADAPDTSTGTEPSPFYSLVSRQMNEMQMSMEHDGSLDKQFVQMMIVHHQSGIEMAETYLANGASRAELKAIAEKIIRTQRSEIEVMREWLAKNG